MQPFADFDLSTFRESSDDAERIGVYFADCPSGGHDMPCLDYRARGPQGEPTVAHLDQEHDFAVTLVARDFESFIRGLQDAADLVA